MGVLSKYLSVTMLDSGIPLYYLGVSSSVVKEPRKSPKLFLLTLFAYASPLSLPKCKK